MGEALVARAHFESLRDAHSSGAAIRHLERDYIELPALCQARLNQD